MDQIQFARQALLKKYTSIKNKNPSYSFRAFAKSLGIAVSTYSEFMSGKKDLGPTRLDAIMKKILPTTEELQEYEGLPYKALPPMRSVSSLADFRSVEGEHFYRLLDPGAYLVLADEQTFREIVRRFDTFLNEVYKLSQITSALEEKKAYVLLLNTSEVFAGPAE